MASEQPNSWGHILILTKQQEADLTKSVYDEAKRACAEEDDKLQAPKKQAFQAADKAYEAAKEATYRAEDELRQLVHSANIASINANFAQNVGALATTVAAPETLLGKLGVAAASALNSAARPEGFDLRAGATLADDAGLAIRGTEEGAVGVAGVGASKLSGVKDVLTQAETLKYLDIPSAEIGEQLKAVEEYANEISGLKPGIVQRAFGLDKQKLKDAVEKVKQRLEEQKEARDARDEADAKLQHHALDYGACVDQRAAAGFAPYSPRVINAD